MICLQPPAFVRGEDDGAIRCNFQHAGKAASVKPPHATLPPRAQEAVLTGPTPAESVQHIMLGFLGEETHTCECAQFNVLQNWDGLYRVQYSANISPAPCLETVEKLPAAHERRSPCRTLHPRKRVPQLSGFEPCPPNSTAQNSQALAALATFAGY